MEHATMQEISRRQIPLARNVETSVQWGRSPLTVRTDKGLVLLDFSHNLLCYDKDIDAVQSLVVLPKTSPASKLFTSQFLKTYKSNMNHNQMIIDPICWPHNPDLMKELASFTAWQFSPPEFLFHCKRLIATVTNLGQVNLFGHHRLSMISVLCLSNIIEELYDLRIPEPALHISSESFETLMHAASSVETCAICWGPNVNDYCYFITAQRNSDVLFWKLQLCDCELQATLISKIKLESSEVVTMHWIPKTAENFLLIYSNILGELVLLECEYADQNISIKKLNVLWKHQDRMLIKYLKHTTIDTKQVLIFVKHRHVVIQVLEDDNIVKSQCYHNVNDNRITGLVESKKQYYLCTENCKIFRMTVALKDEINIEFIPIHTKDTYSTYSLHGIDFSENSVILAMALVDKTVSLRKERVTVDIAYLIPDNNEHEELKILFSKPAKKITELEECLELIRYKAMKVKALPEIDYKQLYAEGNTDLYKLKLYLVFVILYKNLQKSCSSNLTDTLPETSILRVKETILAKHAENVLDCLFKTYQVNGKKFTTLEQDSFAHAIKYLEYFCDNHKRNLNDFVNIDIIDVVNVPLIKETCEFCDEVNVGFSCKNGHLKIFCTVTFIPILNDKYLYCSRCNAIATIELLPDKPTCTFCDLLLDTF